MLKNSYRGKITPHLFPDRKWFITMEGKPAMLRKKGVGFIVIEGLDGSGQSTQAAFLRDFLFKKGFKIVLTKEPTLLSASGKKIKKILDKKEKISPKELQELFTQNRKEHLKKIIIPSLKTGKIVISDRYFFSTFAYGTAEGLNLEWLIKINKDFLLPDLTFFLKVSPEVCLQRIKKRGLEEKLFERKDKLKKVFEVYKILPKRFKNVYSLALTKDNGIYMIDGERKKEEVFSQIKKIINDKIKKRIF